MINSKFVTEVMKLVSEYGRANRNLSRFSPEEQDLAWDAVDAAYERITKKMYHTEEDDPCTPWLWSSREEVTDGTH